MKVRSREIDAIQVQSIEVCIAQVRREPGISISPGIPGYRASLEQLVRASVYHRNPRPSLAAGGRSKVVRRLDRENAPEGGIPLPECLQVHKKYALRSWSSHILRLTVVYYPAMQSVQMLFPK